VQSLSATHIDDPTRSQARRGLLIYFAVLVPLSALIQAVIIRADLKGGENGLLQWLVLITALMYVPTIASVVARLALHEGFADVSFRLGGRRSRNAIVLALILPALVGLVAYGAGWATGLVGFAPRPVGLWVAGLVVSLILNLITVPGEEIGWRGYMVTRLIDAGVPHPIIASSLIWGVWHIPLILWAGFATGPSPLLSIAVFMVLCLPLGYLHARLRLATGSVWPAIALHVAWNTIIQAGFDPAAVGGQEAVWVGESGVLTALTLLAVALIYSRRRWTIVRTPEVYEPAALTTGNIRLHPSHHE
jgi:membrane protease YdiL (CAAX protease family)